MASKLHSRLIEKVIKAIRDEGFVAVRLDKREIPDAFYIEDGVPVAIEIETCQSPPYQRHSEFEKQILIRRKYNRDNVPKYLRVISLRKEGHSYREIQRQMETEFGVRLSLALLQGWVKGTKKPLGLYFGNL